MLVDCSSACSFAPYNHVNLQQLQDSAMADKINVYKYFVSKCIASMQQLTTCMKQGSAGFTMVELIVVMGILSVLATLASPSYMRYIKTVKNSACFADLRSIDKAITDYAIEKNALPASLTDVGMANQLDPWKRQFVYQNLGEVGSVPLTDIANIALNLDYDLYSKGDNGDSSTVLPSDDPVNADDIVRSNNGVFVGLRP